MPEVKPKVAATKKRSKKLVKAFFKDAQERSIAAALADLKQVHAKHGSVVAKLAINRYLKAMRERASAEREFKEAQERVERARKM